MTIVDMTTEAAFPRERAGKPLDSRPRKVRKASEPLSTPGPSWQSGPQTHSSVSSSPGDRQNATSIIQVHQTPKNPVGTAKYFHHQVAIPLQPSNAGAFEVFLVKQFLDFSQVNQGPGSPTSWLMNLPEWISKSQVLAFRCSVRASTTALHALLHNDVSAQKESCRWYGASLNRFRIYLKYQTEKGLVEGNPKFVPGHEEILIPAFLSLFEAFTQTTPDVGIVQHLAAASKILALRGPENCKSGIYHQMFLLTRFANVC
jgi:hypothetical protein